MRCMNIKRKVFKLILSAEYHPGKSLVTSPLCIAMSSRSMPISMSQRVSSNLEKHGARIQHAKKEE